jgi:hypothetical protein
VSDLLELTRGEEVQVSGGGRLRTYLGTAPGVGKTFAMLAEGRQRAGSGERVMAGWIEWEKGLPVKRLSCGRSATAVLRAVHDKAESRFQAVPASAPSGHHADRSGQARTWGPGGLPERTTSGVTLL